MSWIGDDPGKQRRRRPRRSGRASSDAERRALAKANAHPSPWERVKPRPGFAMLTVDGGSRATPPMAAIGYVLQAADGTALESHGERIGLATPTVAEYRALLAGLQRAYSLGLERVDARSDSRLVVSHLTRTRIPRNPRLIELGEQIVDLTRRIGSVTVAWIPSAANGAAHALVADALGSPAGRSGPEQHARIRHRDG